MTLAPRYPSPTWDCGICGRTNPGDIGSCVRCGDRFGGGGLEKSVMDPSRIWGEYLPMWHYGVKD